MLNSYFHITVTYFAAILSTKTCPHFLARGEGRLS